MKEKIKQLMNRLKAIGMSYNKPLKENHLEELFHKSLESDFWKTPNEAQKVTREISEIKAWLKNFYDIRSELNLLTEFKVIHGEILDDPEINYMITTIEEKITKMEIEIMFIDKDDDKVALFSIQAGAGGTEAQDWTSILLKMYCKWFDRKGFTYNIVDVDDGEIAGIKSATIEVSGKNAFGYCKAEIGVHRLVRISPFDSNKKRHTSFASVYVLPESEDINDIRIDESEVRIDTFRGSGAGGQHRNKTDSAIRITHLETKIVSQCQAERSQFQNKEKAFKFLKVKLLQHFKNKEEERNNASAAEKKKIEWGSQIRSYVLQPFTMIKDLRTGYKTSNVNDVLLNGNLDKFVETYLMQKG